MKEREEGREEKKREGRQRKDNGGDGESSDFTAPKGWNKGGSGDQTSFFKLLLGSQQPALFLFQNHFLGDLEGGSGKALIRMGRGNQLQTKQPKVRIIRDEENVSEKVPGVCVISAQGTLIG